MVDTKYSDISETKVDLRLSPYDRWAKALQNLPSFSVKNYRKSFEKFIKPLYDASSPKIHKLVFEIAKKPHIIFGSYNDELIALSEILNIRFDLLLFQNITYELFCVENQKKVQNLVGCTGIICLADGVLTLGRNVDFDYNQFWRKFTFNAEVIDEHGKGILCTKF